MIVYYVHHHGSGHAHRAASIAAHCRTPVVGTGSGPVPPGWPGEWVPLPADADGIDPADTRQRADHDVTAGGTLHWAPCRHPGLRARAAALSALLDRDPARLLVADVSVEVSLLARLHGVPVAVLAQPGTRTDRPHRTAYDLASVLLAPWPATPGRPVPEPWVDRTVHLGGLSRYDDRTPGPAPGRRRVLVLSGSGGGDLDAAAVTAAARATPGWTWEVAGRAPVGTADGPVFLGWTDDVWPALRRADVVVGHCGQNVVAEIAAARRAAVLIPQPRPFGEQDETAAVLERAGLAEVRPRWPEPAQWPAVLAAALARGGAGWSRWSDGTAAPRAAAVLDGLASG